MIQKRDSSQKRQVTQEGFEILRRELEDLKAKRPSVVDRLANARSMGDLSENNDYQSAREALDFLDNRVDELEGIIKSVEIAKKVEGNGSFVALGSRVKLGINGTQHVFHIVGEWEADPKEKKISHESPLGSALVGKKIGEKVEVEAPAGKITYTVLGIE